MTAEKKDRPAVARLVASDENRARDYLKIVIVGHVDHGKSTLVGRLFHDTGSLPEGKLEAIQKMSERRGMPFEWAFLMDAMQAERDQGITIDTSQIWFKTARRDYVIIDAPGHKEFLKNMVTGAAQADAAVLVIDAHEGVQEQSRRHGYLLHLLGIRQVLVAVNKMDMVGYGQQKFEAVAAEYRAYLAEIGVEATHIIPVSAREGDNLVTGKGQLGWYQGPTLVEALDGFRPEAAPVELPLRLPVQDVYKFDTRRLIVGRIETGHLSVGDQVIFSPSNKVTKIKSIEQWGKGAAPVAARAGQSVAITLEEQLFVERGEVMSHLDKAPVETDVFKARIFWLGRESLKKGQTYKIKFGTAEVQARVEKIENLIDTGDLSQAADVAEVGRNQVAELVLRAKKLIAIDEFTASPRTGRFVIVDKYDIAGGGVAFLDGYADQRKLVTHKGTNLFRVAHRVSAEERAARNGHKGGVVWLTGLSASGKSTIALELERRLHDSGFQAYVLDGDNVREGLNSNLGFSPEDRAENIRRVGEVAALFARSGLIALTAFISPYRSDRARARAAMGGADFHEIHVKADVETCARRDPKGLYAKARKGEIKDFTGISAPYEAPESPELVIDTEQNDVETCVAQLMDYIKARFS